MLAVKIIIGSLMIICSLVIIAVVLRQQGRQNGVSIVTGNSETYLSKNKGRDKDMQLSRATKWFAIGFFVLAVVANVIALL